MHFMVTKEKDINKARSIKFRRKHTKKNKAIDMSALPPCKGKLLNYTRHENIMLQKCGDVFAKKL